MTDKPENLSREDLLEWVDDKILFNVEMLQHYSGVGTSGWKKEGVYLHAIRILIQQSTEQGGIDRTWEEEVAELDEEFLKPNTQEKPDQPEMESPELIKAQVEHDEQFLKPIDIKPTKPSQGESKK